MRLYFLRWKYSESQVNEVKAWNWIFHFTKCKLSKAAQSIRMWPQSLSVPYSWSVTLRHCLWLTELVVNRCYLRQRLSCAFRWHRWEQHFISTKTVRRMTLGESNRYGMKPKTFPNFVCLQISATGQFDRLHDWIFNRIRLHSIFVVGRIVSSRSSKHSQLNCRIV